MIVDDHNKAVIDNDDAQFSDESSDNDRLLIDESSSTADSNSNYLPFGSDNAIKNKRVRKVGQFVKAVKRKKVEQETRERFAIPKKMMKKKKQSN